MGEADERDDPLDVVTRRLVSDEHEATVGAMCAAMFAAHPAYEAMRDKEGLRLGVSHVLQLFCSTAAERRPMVAEERSSLHVMGSQRARQGVAEREIVGGLKVATGVVWDVVTGLLAEHCETTEQLHRLTRELFHDVGAFVDDAGEELLAGFRAEVEQPLPGRVRAQATVIDHLVDTRQGDAGHYELARRHGVPVLPPLAVFVVVGAADTGGAVLRQAAKQIVDAVPDVVEGGARVTGSPHVILFANHVDKARLEQLQHVGRAVGEQVGVVVVMANPVDGPSLVRTAYGSLGAGLAVARLARPHGGLLTVDELRLYNLIALMPPDQRAVFTLGVLDGLLQLPEPKRRPLLEALDAWVRAGGVTKVACDLLRGVSAPTVRYRLRRIEELLNKSLADPNDQWVVMAAWNSYRAWLVPITENAR